MSSEARTGKPDTKGYQHILLFGVLAVLPTIDGALFGPVFFVIPPVVFFFMYKWENGFRYVVAGLAGAAVISIVLGSFWTMVFTATLVPVGYVLASSAFKLDSAVLSGCKATLTLTLSWLLLFIIVSGATGSNPISDFITSLNEGLKEAISYYQEHDSLPPESIALIEQSRYQIETVLPKIVLSLIIGTALLIVWFTMVSGNHFVPRITGYQPWAEQRTWKLPERLVWLLIASAVITMLPLGILRIIGINALIVFSFIYFFQGFAILVFFMNKWSVPTLLRVFFYGMMLLQQFGTLALIVIGIGDVWFNIRKLNRDAAPDNNIT